MRYRYINKAYLAHGAEHGVLCDPVRRDDGRCIVSGSSQLVTFEDGEQCIVIRRCLRLTSKEQR